MKPNPERPKRAGLMTGDTAILVPTPSVHLKCRKRTRRCDGAEATRNPGLHPGCHEQAISLREVTRN
jgi:hypothetical protein